MVDVVGLFIGDAHQDDLVPQDPFLHQKLYAPGGFVVEHLGVGITVPREAAYTGGAGEVDQHCAVSVYRNSDGADRYEPAVGREVGRWEVEEAPDRLHR